MSKESLNELGNIFFTTKGYQCRGVGWLVAYRIIKDRNGDIDLKSDVGEELDSLRLYRRA